MRTFTCHPRWNGYTVPYVECRVSPVVIFIARFIRVTRCILTVWTVSLLYVVLPTVILPVPVPDLDFARIVIGCVNPNLAILVVPVALCAFTGVAHNRCPHCLTPLVLPLDC